MSPVYLAHSLVVYLVEKSHVSCNVLYINWFIFLFFFP